MRTLNLSDQGETLLQRFAKDAGKAPDSYLEDIVMEYLGDMEDAYLARRELDAVNAGTSTTATLQEVMKEYGMDDQTL